MINNPYIISWNNRSFWTDLNVFSPKDSTLGIFAEIEEATKLFLGKVPILDLCCGIGAIGICTFLNNPNHFYKYHGLDNDFDSIEICKKNIKLHKINGVTSLWEAGENLPKIERGVVICNPPFLPKSDFFNVSVKESLVCSDNDGLEVLLKCFQSTKGTGHILILKSLKSQVSKIRDEVGTDFILKREVEHEIEQDYIIAFTTWKQK